MWGMQKTILLIVALVGCGKKEDGNTGAVNPNKPSPKAVAEKLIADPIVEKAIRHPLLGIDKRTGELTEADLEEVTSLFLASSKITDAGLKEVAKLQQLKSLNLNSNKITKAGVAELQKALPKCKIISNPTKQLSLTSPHQTPGAPWQS